MNGMKAAVQHRHTPAGTHEHEFEAAPGLPEPLPADERILWQGSPDWRGLARHRFHALKLAVYFAALLAVRAGFVQTDNGDLHELLSSLVVLGSLGAFSVGVAVLMAWLTARTTVYTLTDRRVVMRIGIVLTLTLNLPLRVIESAAVRRPDDATGDISLRLSGPDRIAYLHLWPHARPWRLARPEPVLLCLTGVREVSVLLTQAWDAAGGNGGRAAPAPSPVGAWPGVADSMTVVGAAR